MLTLLELLMLLVYSMLTALLILMVMQHLMVVLMLYILMVVVILDLLMEVGQENPVKFNTMQMLCTFKVVQMVITLERVMVKLL